MRAAWILMCLVGAGALAWLALASEAPERAAPAQPAESSAVAAEPAATLVAAETSAVSREPLDAEPGTSPEPRAPVIADESANADAAPGQITLMGRVLDERGSPQAGLKLRILPLPHEDHYGTTETQEDGRFVMLGPAQAWARAERVFLVYGDFWNESTERCDARYATIALQTPLQEPHDLGDIVCAPFPKTISGTIRSTDGKPVRAQLVLFTSALIPEAPPYRVDMQRRARSDESGWFALHGTAQSVFTLHVDPEPRDFPPQTFGPFESGALELDVVVQPAANRHLPARVVLDPDVPLESIAAWLERPDGTRTSSIRLSRRGFTFRQHAAGAYDLTICMAKTRQPLLEITALELPAGVECTDLRLTEIDLRGRFSRIRMHVRAGPDRPAADAEFSVTHSNGARERVVTDASGNGSIIVLREQTEVVIHAMGDHPIAVRDGATLELDDVRTPFDARH